MKKTIIIGIITTMLFTACNSTEPIPVPENEKLVKIEMQLPQYYAMGDWEKSQSRADLNDSGYLPSNFWTDYLKNLPENSTLWVIYEKKIDDSNYSTPELKGYIVKADAGYNSLYACTTSTSDDIISINTETWGAPLYLEEGTYRFRIVTPAYPIKQKDNKMFMNIDNGTYLFATDDRYERTKTQNIEIVYTGGQERVQYITLPPMIAQTASMGFTIEKGDNVYSLEMLDAGIEISGIQPSGKDWDITTALPMERGNKRGITRIKGDLFTTDEHGNLTGDTSILPTYAESNSIVILINIAVNGIPTQYQTVLNGMNFWHACSYNLKLKVSVKDNIVVMTWQNQSWVTDQKW